MDDNQGALGDFNELIRLRPGDSTSYFTRGLVRAQLERYESAVADLDMAHRLDPRHTPTLVSRGLNRVRLRQYDLALDDYNAALRLEPDNREAHYLRGSMQQERGQYRAARADYERAVSLKPDQSSYRNQLAWLLATCPQDNIRDGAKAVEHATRACELTDWKDGNLLDTLAAALAEAGRFAEAVEYARKSEPLVTPDLRGDVRDHIELFQRGKPFRAKPVALPAPSRAVPPGRRKKRR